MGWDYGTSEQPHWMHKLLTARRCFDHLPLGMNLLGGHSYYYPYDRSYLILNFYYTTSPSELGMLLGMLALDHLSNESLSVEGHFPFQNRITLPLTYLLPST